MSHPTPARVVLITGAARRIGAAIARHLHAAGYRVLIHCHRSREEALALCEGLNAFRPGSAALLQADLSDGTQRQQLAEQAAGYWGRLDGLVNNASSFYPTPLETSTDAHWDELMGSNLRAPYFLIQALSGALAAHQGAVVNLVDIHAQRPLQGYPIYSIAKAGLSMLTQSLAKELAPAVRVNGVAPGPILWPEQQAALSEAEQRTVLAKVPLGRTGTPEEIASAVHFLLEAGFITGQVLAVDGGKSLYS